MVDPIAFDVGVKPIRGWTTGGAEKFLKSMIERTALDGTLVIDPFDGIQTALMNRLAFRIKEGHSNMPFSNTCGRVPSL